MNRERTRTEGFPEKSTFATWIEMTTGEAEGQHVSLARSMESGRYGSVPVSSLSDHNSHHEGTTQSVCFDKNTTVNTAVTTENSNILNGLHAVQSDPAKYGLTSQYNTWDGRGLPPHPKKKPDNLRTSSSRGSSMTNISLSASSTIEQQTPGVSPTEAAYPKLSGLTESPGSIRHTSIIPHTETVMTTTTEESPGKLEDVGLSRSTGPTRAVRTSQLLSNEPKGTKYVPPANSGKDSKFRCIPAVRSASSRVRTLFKHRFSSYQNRAARYRNRPKETDLGSRFS